VQSKVGTTDFSRTWETMRRKVSEKRDERRDARNQMVRIYCWTDGSNADIQAVRDPKTWAERKSKKGAIKKDSKKRRVKAFA
jgi:U3 small nucleolar RNA-associated protein 20